MPLIKERATLAIVTGVWDVETIKKIIPDVEKLPEYRAFLQRENKSIFNSWEGVFIERNVNELFPKITSVCIGNFDSVEKQFSGGVSPGSHVNGWAWDRNNLKPVERIVLTDESGKIIGLAQSDQQRPDVSALYPEVRQNNVGWNGYLRSFKGRSTAYAVVENGQAICRLGSL